MVVSVSTASQSFTLPLCRWLGVIIEGVGSCVVFFTALFTTLNRVSLSSGLAGVAVTCALQVKNLFILMKCWCFKNSNLYYPHCWWKYCKHCFYLAGVPGFGHPLDQLTWVSMCIHLSQISCEWCRGKEIK